MRLSRNRSVNRAVLSARVNAAGRIILPKEEYSINSTVRVRFCFQSCKTDGGIINGKRRQNRFLAIPCLPGHVSKPRPNIFTNGLSQNSLTDCPAAPAHSCKPSGFLSASGLREIRSADCSVHILKPETTKSSTPPHRSPFTGCSEYA